MEVEGKEEETAITFLPFLQRRREEEEEEEERGAIVASKGGGRGRGEEEEEGWYSATHQLRGTAAALR